MILEEVFLTGFLEVSQAVQDIQCRYQKPCCVVGARGVLDFLDGFWAYFTLYPESISGSQRHAGESEVNHQRYFERVLGREPKSSDRLMAKIAWIWRWLSDPINGFRMFIDKVKGPPSLPPLSPGVKGS